MKLLIIGLLILVAASQVFALDCNKVLTFSTPVDCTNLTRQNARKEDREIVALLKRKIDSSDFKNNYLFVKNNTICSDELRSIQDYSSFNYRIYNPALRSGKAEGIDDSFQKDICLISKGLSKIPLFQGPVYRGMRLKREFAENYLKVGNVIEEKSFLSTDKNLSTAIGFSRSNDPSDSRIVLMFEDSVGHEIRRLSLNPLEDEVLIDRGKNFIVSSVEKMNDGSEYYLVVLLKH